MLLMTCHFLIVVIKYCNADYILRDGVIRKGVTHSKILYLQP